MLCHALSVYVMLSAIMLSELHVDVPQYIELVSFNGIIHMIQASEALRFIRLTNSVF